MRDYVKLKRLTNLIRLPLEGYIDLTYRCNNNCRHCWVRIPVESPERSKELSLEEIKRIVEEARTMGCRRWILSGGEPMVREDFVEIFDYIIHRSAAYALNTNGTLITPRIARMMKRKGIKWVALYGATADVHDHITRKPGSFEETMQGIAYLKEAGAGFTVQLIPMKDNYHEFKEMVKLTESLSTLWRVGASWLYFSAAGDPVKNEEIREQRLPPEVIRKLESPVVSREEGFEGNEINSSCLSTEGKGLFAACVSKRRDFHIDPYGGMSFCSMIKEPSSRFDLRKGSFSDGWERFIPTLADSVKADKEYVENCGSCELRGDCGWCPVYGFLEHRRFSAKVNYLCDMARVSNKFKEYWNKNHRRYFQIAGLTVQVDSDLPITDRTFHPKFKHFEVDKPGKDVVTIRHHFFLPDLTGRDLGKEVYRQPPWAIYKKGDSWIYLGISPDGDNERLHRVVVFNRDYSRGRFYNIGDDLFRKGNRPSLTLFTTDQILLAQLMADREGLFLHSSGVDFRGRGILFVGHSDAGKSTMIKMLRSKAEVLCDDRIIVRRWPEGFTIHGTWSHGEIPDVSARSAPLKGLFFLEQAGENRLIPVESRKEANRKVLACLIRPLMTADWWEKTLILVEKLTQEVPSFILRFDKSGLAVDLIRGISSEL